ncbi:conserved protein, unknown function [Hepatocystis sp. ex Piliocolobus tephrosceles]|nr:conserved protein, unknown function [Hepatocystis sp. ex Piliocolobus tephrosceles]
MIQIYREHINGSYYFSKVFSYIILFMQNKTNFFKKRELKNLPLFNNCKNTFSVKKRKTINENQKKKNLVIHFATSEISYFFYNYFVYILIPQLNCLKECEKKKLIENIYLVDLNNVEKEQKTEHVIYNKIKLNICNIIFCNNILPHDKYDYNKTLALFLENTYFFDLFQRSCIKQKIQNKKKLCSNEHLKKGKYINNIKTKYPNLSKNKTNIACNNFLYVTYFFQNNYNHKKKIIIKTRKKNLQLCIKYNNIIKEINKKIKWIKHSSFYKFYSTAYISFLKYRMQLFQHYVNKYIINQSKKKAKKNNIYLFFTYKLFLLYSNIFFDFINNKIIYIDFNQASDIYIPFLTLQQTVYMLYNTNNNKTLYYCKNNGISDDHSISKKNLINEMKTNINIHVWDKNQKETFYLTCSNIKFRKFYN